MTRKADILKMRLQGMTYKQIGEVLDISRQRVQQLISPPLYIRKLIFHKAWGKCELCGAPVGWSGHIHHKGNTEEDYNDIVNLQFLCQSCHVKAHFEITQREFDTQFEQQK